MKHAMQKINSAIKQEEGFTLLEILLSLGIFAFIALSLVQASQDYVQDKRSIVAAEHMKTVHKAAYTYIMDNFEDIYNVGLGGTIGTGNTMLIPIENDGTSIHYLKRDPDLLPSNFNARSPFGQTVVVLLRNAGNRNIEVVSMSTGRPIAERQVEAAASALGGYGGFWSAVDRNPDAATTTDSVIGAYGMWSVPVAGLTTPTWPAANSPTLDGGAYLASYQWINYTNEIGDYLYRVALPLAPEANAMMTAIDMNNYNIDGADDVAVGGNMIVQSGATLAGSARVTGTTAVTGDLTVSTAGVQGFVKNGTTLAGSVDTTTAIDSVNFIRDAAGVDATDIVVGNTITATGSASGIETINAETTEASGLTLTNADMLAVTIDVNQINVPAGTVETNLVNGGSITTNGIASVETLGGNGTTTINGSTFILNDSVVNGNVTIQNGAAAGQFSCDIGC